MEKRDLFDFDTVLERRGTASLKWEKYREQDIIPLWVADMDFRSPPAVIRALQQRIENGVFGYTITPDDLNETVMAMLHAKYAWKVEPEWLVWLPGLSCALAVIPAKKLRRSFIKVMAGIVPRVNAVGYTAARVAFEECDEWHAALLEYLRGNLAAVEQAIHQMPKLSMAPVEATYLAWIDMRDSGIKNPAAFFEDAGVGLQDGIEFDAPGFVRLNFGCPRSLLEKALDRMTMAMGKLSNAECGMRNAEERKKKENGSRKSEWGSRKINQD